MGNVNNCIDNIHNNIDDIFVVGVMGYILTYGGIDVLYIFKDSIIVKHLSGLNTYGHNRRYHLSKLRKRVEFLGYGWEEFLTNLIKKQKERS